MSISIELISDIFEQFRTRSVEDVNGDLSFVHIDLGGTVVYANGGHVSKKIFNGLIKYNWLEKGQNVTQNWMFNLEFTLKSLETYQIILNEVSELYVISRFFSSFAHDWPTIM